MMAATGGRFGRRGRDRRTSRARSIREGQDIVAPISGSEDARADFGRSATADEAIPAQATFLDRVTVIQGAIHHRGRFVHVGTEKFNTEDPPANETVRVKSIVVPQTNAGEVLTWKGVVFVPVAFSAVSG